MIPRASAAEAMPEMPALAHTSWRWGLGALLVALLAQTTLLHGLQVRGGTISFAFLVVLWFAASAGTARGALFGLIAGALEDAFSGGAGAAWTFATPLAAIVAARSVRTTGWDHPLFLGFVTVVAACLRSFVFWFVTRAEHPLVPLDATTVHAALWSAALDALVVVIATAALPRLRPLRVDRR
jgi:rod shape-determining protein MreD